MNGDIVFTELINSLTTIFFNFVVFLTISIIGFKFSLYLTFYNKISYYLVVKLLLDSNALQMNFQWFLIFLPA
jgi:hypothetical protein